MNGNVIQLDDRRPKNRGGFMTQMEWSEALQHLNSDARTVVLWIDSAMCALCGAQACYPRDFALDEEKEDTFGFLFHNIPSELSDAALSLVCVQSKKAVYLQSSVWYEEPVIAYEFGYTDVRPLILLNDDSCKPALMGYLQGILSAISTTGVAYYNLAKRIPITHAQVMEFMESDEMKAYAGSALVRKKIRDNYFARDLAFPKLADLLSAIFEVTREIHPRTKHYQLAAMQKLHKFSKFATEGKLGRHFTIS